MNAANEDQLNIVVCVKAVPSTTEVKMDPKTNTIVRDGKTMNVDVTLDQEESSVNGSSGSDSNGNSQNNQNNQNGNGQNGYGNGNGNSDGGTGDGGGFSDPFGLW